MYKAIVNITTGNVGWIGDDKSWTPKVRTGFSLATPDGEMPRPINENEKYIYVLASNTVIIETLPSLQYEGKTVYRKRQIKKIAREKINALLGDGLTQYRRWRASHVLNNQADFSAQQITNAQIIVDNAIAISAQITTIQQEKDTAIADLEAL